MPLPRRVDFSQHDHLGVDVGDLTWFAGLAMIPPHLAIRVRSAGGSGEVQLRASGVDERGDGQAELDPSDGPAGPAATLAEEVPISAEEGRITHLERPLRSGTG